MQIFLLVICALITGVAAATEPEAFLAAYAAHAKLDDSTFSGFSAARGRAF